MILSSRNLGTGEPVIVLHGLLGNGSNWLPIARTFEAHRRWLLPDLRNHGASPHTDVMSLDSMADDIEHLMIEHGIASASVVGHSLGGKVAMTLALRSPQSVARLCVVDIAPVPYRSGHHELLDTMAALDLGAVQQREDANQQLAKHVADPRIRAFILTNLQRTPTGFTWRVNLPALQASLTDLSGFDAEGAYDGDCVFIGGSDSDYIRDTHHTTIKGYFPRAAIDVIANAGHWPHVDQPERFGVMLQDFLRIDT
jgi:esterase